MWDLQGQDRVIGGIGGINKLFCKGAAGAIVVADITDILSIENTANWKRQVNDHVAQTMGQSKFNNTNFDEA